jgi:hypothetical protein
MNQADVIAAFVGEVRGIQGMHPKAHQALLNWAMWSRDLAGMCPTLAPPALWNEADPTKWGDFADEGDVQAAVIAPQAEPAKGEKAWAEPGGRDYNEKEAIELDILLHREIPDYAVRKCLLAAYVARDIPEEQYPLRSCCTHEGFLMSLTSSLHKIEEALE